MVSVAKTGDEFANKISGETHQSCKSFVLKARHFLRQEKGS